MVVLVGEDGSVENRVFPLPPGLTASALTEASNYLQHFAVGRTLNEARKALLALRQETMTQLAASSCTIHKTDNKLKTKYKLKKVP